MGHGHGSLQSNTKNLTVDMFLRVRFENVRAVVISRLQRVIRKGQLVLQLQGLVEPTVSDGIAHVDSPSAQDASARCCTISELCQPLFEAHPCVH